MDETIEQRMHRLSRCSLTEELANSPDEFGWWIVANYGEHLLFQSDPSKEADAVKYTTQLAEFCSWDYHGALHQVRENYLMYLQARANRIGEEYRETHLGNFMSHAVYARGYTSKLVEALDDHLGLAPEDVGEYDANTMRQVYEKLYDIEGLLAPYGYVVDPERFE